MVKDGDIRYLYKKEYNGNITKATESKLIDLWDDLFNDYFVRFGMTESFKNYMDKRMQIGKMKLDCIVNDRPHMVTFIEIAELELNEIEVDPPDFLSTVVTLEKFLGFSIDTRTCSVAKYNAYLNSINGKG